MFRIRLGPVEEQDGADLFLGAVQVALFLQMPCFPQEVDNQGTLKRLPDRRKIHQELFQ